MSYFDIVTEKNSLIFIDSCCFYSQINTRSIIIIFIIWSIIRTVLQSVIGVVPITIA